MSRFDLSPATRFPIQKGVTQWWLDCSEPKQYVYACISGLQKILRAGFQVFIEWRVFVLSKTPTTVVWKSINYVWGFDDHYEVTLYQLTICHRL